MAGSVKQDVSIRVALAGQESWKSYREAMANARSETAKLKQDLKEIANLGKAFEAQKIFNTPGGFYRAVNGQSFQGQMRAQRQMDMGMSGVQELAQAKENLRLANDLLKTFDKIGGLLAANNVKLGTTEGDLRRITSLAEAKNRLSGTEIQLADALKQKDAARVADLSRQRDILKDQVGLLAQQQKNAAKPTPQQMAQHSRENTMNRLFGDGGVSLLAVQAGISANYMLLNTAKTAFQSSIQFAIDLDDSLRNLQAITVTTDENMVQLKETITDVASATKFSAVEVAQAATTLGQAGMSVQQIRNSIGAVAMLASATGTDLSQAVDVATSTLDVFNLESSQMGHVANVLTAAVNESKLNIDKLALGLQYAGNTAAESGVSFEELTAALGAMSNAGIRSGSTLGTGMRQIILSLQKPSKEFVETMDRLGVTFNDIDLESQGIYGALKNLKDAGFTASDAMKAFEIRGAAAFTALSRNLDSMLTMEQGFLSSTAAIKANDIQMQSFANTAKNFSGTFMSVVETGLQPFLLAARDILGALTNGLQALLEHKTALTVFTTAVTAAGTALAIMWPLKMLANITLFKTGIAGVTAVVTELAMVAPGLAAGLRGVGAALGLATGPIGWVVTALGLGITAWVAYSNEAAKAKQTMEQLQTAFDKSAGEMTEQAGKIKTVGEELEKVRNRYDQLKSNQTLLSTEITKVRNEFAEIGLDVNTTITTVDDLIANLEDLREQLAEDYVITIRVAEKDLKELIKEQKAQIAEEVANIASTQSDLQNSYFTPDPRLQQLLTDAQAPNLRADQVVGLRARQQQMLAENAAIMGSIQSGNISERTVQSYANRGVNNAVDLYRLKEEERAALEGLTDPLNRLQVGLSDLATNVAKANQLDLAGRVAQDKLQPGVSYIDTRLGQISGNLPNKVDAAIKAAPAGDVAAQGAAAQGVANQTVQELEMLRANLSKMNIAPETYEEMVATIEGIKADVMKQIEPYVSAADKQADELRKLDMDRLNAELQDAQQQVNDATDMTSLTDAMVTATDLMFEQYQNTLDQIAASKDTQAVKDEKIRQADAELQRQLGELGSTVNARGVDLESAALDNGIRQAEIGIAAATQQRDTATTEDGVGAAMTRIQELLMQKAELDRQKAALEARDAETARIAIEGINQQLSADLLANEQAGASQQKELRDKAIEDLKNRIEETKNAAARQDAELERQLANATSPEAAKAITEQRVKAQQALQVALQALMEQVQALDANSMTADMIAEMVATIAQAIFDIQSAGDRKAEDAAETAAALEEEARDKKIADLKADIELAKQLRDNAYALAEKAATLEARNKFLEEAMRQSIAIMNAEKGIANLENPDGGKSLETALATAQANFDAEMIKIGNIRSSKLGGKGGGGGGGDKKTEVEKFIEEAQAKIDAFKAMVEADLISGAAGMVGIDQIVSSTKAKLAEVDAKIAGMKSLVDDSGMSVKEVEQLNQLLKERKGLTDALAGAEALVTEQMIKQGDYMGAMSNIARTWAQQNLDVAKTFQQGFENVLSTLTSGFATLFTDLVSGTKTAGQAFRDFAVSVVKSLMNMIAQMIAVYIMQKLIGMVFPGAQTPGSFGAIAQQVAGITPSMTGGAVRKAGGGMVEGNLARDSRLHNLMPGEFVMRKSAVDMIGVDALNQMNSMGNRAMAGGGHVGVMNQKKGPIGQTNVYVVSPDQQPVPGPADIIAVINDDIARGGSTKKLIKTVAMGY